MNHTDQPPSVLRVAVTSALIAEGICNSVRVCPVAMAVENALRELDRGPVREGNVMVSATTVVWLPDIDHPWRGSLPPAAQRFINAFDTISAQRPGPINFMLVLDPVP